MGKIVILFLIFFNFNNAKTLQQIFTEKTEQVSKEIQQSSKEIKELTSDIKNTINDTKSEIDNQLKNNEVTQDTKETVDSVKTLMDSYKEDFEDQTKELEIKLNSLKSEFNNYGDIIKIEEKIKDIKNQLKEIRKNFENLKNFLSFFKFSVALLFSGFDIPYKETSNNTQATSEENTILFESETNETRYLLNLTKDIFISKCKQNFTLNRLIELKTLQQKDN